MTTAAPGSLTDPRVLMALRTLELRARAVVEGFRSGLHRSPHHGFSVEFTEYRPYAPGDDLRHLDWRVFARSDRYFLRKFEDETNLRCVFAVDQSRSMDCGSLAWTKAQYAATLAAALAHFLDAQGDATGLLSFDNRVRDYLPARHRPGHLRRLMLSLERPAGGGSTDLSAPLEHLARLMSKRGMIALVTDFLVPLDGLAQRLSLLTARGHDVMLFRVLDPTEAVFTFPDAALFEDAETGRTLFVDPASVSERYAAKFQAHETTLRRLCRERGIALHTLRTDEPLELSLAAFVRERMRRGRVTRRRL